MHCLGRKRWMGLLLVGVLLVSVCPRRVAADPSCGVWDGTASDERIELTRISEATGGECRGAFRLSNGTEVWGFGGYTLELRTVRSENATVIWIALPGREEGVESSLLLSSLDLELYALPVDRFSAAQVSLEGAVTVRSLAADTALFLLKATLELVPGGSCVVPDEQLAYVSVRVAHILAPVAQMAWEGDLVGAKQELEQLLPEFLDRSSATLREVGFDCAADLLEAIIGLPAALVKLVWAYCTWIPVVIMDYLKYKGQPAYVLLEYQMSAAATPTTPVGPGPAPTPPPEFQMATATPEPRGETFTVYETDRYVYNIAIGGNIVAWQGYDILGCDAVMAVDMSTGGVIEAAGYGQACGSFSISGKYFIWAGSHDAPGIRVRDLATGKELSPIALAGDYSSPAISENIVVWADKRNGNWDIYGNDLSTNKEFAVTTAQGDQLSPAISGNVVVWVDNRNGGSDIYGKDLGAEKEFIVSAEPSIETSPKVGESTVVWFEAPSHRFANLWGKDLMTGARFPIVSDRSADPTKGLDVDGSLIAYVSFELTRGWSILAMDISTGTTYRIAGPSLSCEPAGPAVSKGVVVWGCKYGADGGPFGWRSLP